MKTTFFSETELEVAAQFLRSGKLVAFPTETVYGLGADAMNPAAVAKIFEAKGRPADNPLIVHIADPNQVLAVALEVPLVARNLMAQFWPGPLTLVLPKRSEVPWQVTAGLETVAVRFPNHPIALELIRLAGVPLAAPSANLSGRPSATSWQAVAEDLDGRIAGIVCGGPTMVGLESTVVDATCDPPRVLRPGGVSFERLRDVCLSIEPYRRDAADSPPATGNSPGLRHKHYQPRARVIVVSSATKDSEFASSMAGQNVAYYIGLQLPSNPAQFKSMLICSSTTEYAAKLFDFFRKADLDAAQVVFCESVEDVGIGAALLDRLQRASR